MFVFVINQHGEPLMPCSPRKARLLLKNQKATVVCRQPFTIQLRYGSSGYTQEIHLGVDLGAKHVGIAVTSQDQVVTCGEIALRQDIRELLETRKILRRGRRFRKTRYRMCKFRYRTKRVYDAKKKKWVKRTISLASPRLKGWLPPSIESRIANTFRWINRFASRLPKVALHIEVGKFDPHKMINPTIQGVDYQRGQTYGYHEVRYFVFARDQYTCQVCKRKNQILQTHHIVYRSHGGTDRADNLITVCTACHSAENHKPGKILRQWMVQGKKLARYKETTLMNIIRRRVFQRFPHAHVTYGSVTTPHRKTLGLAKMHASDAIAITGISSIRKWKPGVFQVVQFRKKKRSLHEATARKGRKVKNVASKRNGKNTPSVKGFYLNDQVRVFGRVGFITGFTGESMAYVKDITGAYITQPGKSYKQVNLRDCQSLQHNNNWQFIPHLRFA